MALPENLPLADKWRRALAELPIRDRAWFLDCEPNLNDARLLLRFKTALHARNASERVALLLPLVVNWIGAAREIEILLADKSLLLQPVPRLSRPPSSPSRPPASPPVRPSDAPPPRQTAASAPPPAPVTPAVRSSWRPDLDPLVKTVLTKFGGNIVAVSRSSDSPDLPGEL